MVRRPTDGPRQEVADPLLQDVVLRQADRVLDPLGFEVFVDLGICEARVGPEIDARHLALVARYDRREHVSPSVGAVDIAGTQRATFQIAELVEDEQRVEARAIVMAIPGAVLLFAMRRADAQIHVEQNAARRTAGVHKIDPSAGQVSKSRKVLRCREPLRLEAAHLARRGRATVSRMAADNPAHRRIMA